MREILNFLVILILTVGSAFAQPSDKIINLAGEWTVVLDSMDVGMKQAWPLKKLLGDKINLPATLDDAGLGTKNTQKPVMDNSVLWGLTRKHQYIGAAWYQKEIEIPENWKNHEVILQLERVLWESTVFIDGVLIGQDLSLTTPHRYDLTPALTTGKHTITIRIDNSNKYPLINVAGTKYPDPINQDMAHAYTNHTQIKWNGIIGVINLTATTKEKVKNLQVYSLVDENKIKATFDRNFDTELKYQILLPSQKVITGNEISILSPKVLAEGTIKKGKNEITISKPVGIVPWDEFNPILYEFKLISETSTTSVKFGYSQIKQEDKLLKLNGTRIFLRGNLECVIFPLTGRPPMTKAEWAKLIKQAKAYGLNHLRFHSWCPPAAAFEAADEAGFYYQVELPHWSLRYDEDKKTTEFLEEEGERILKEYGNHPSFILMAMGNELQGDLKALNVTTAKLKAKDSRHLFATTSYSFQRPAGLVAQPEDEFFITQRTDKGWIRGQGIFNAKSPNFNEDYTSNSEHVSIPIISHEIGQYSVYPDMSEIKKYTGVLKPLNFMAVRDGLEKNDLLKMAPDFTYASGKLAAILYKEEIERAMKTPAFDGFQLLQLQDFPGQGTALVGLLNAFWESKGVISAEEFSQFNSELVPLIRFEKAVYENGETFEASLEVANFYKELKGQTLNWTISNEKGAVIKKGSQTNVDLLLGNNNNLGTIKLDVNVEKAQKSTVTVELSGTKYKNNWEIWVYPKEVKTNSNKVVFTNSYEEAKEMLAKGKNVLFNPNYKVLKGIDGRFVPVFWSPVHFPNQPSTMGLLMDEKHAAFNDFPTDKHTNWQWWDLCISSMSVVVDDLDVTPIVRVIDNFVTNHHLANVFETKVGKGKLIYSSIDLTNDLDKRPVARQLRASLLQYMESKKFNPSGSVDIDKLDFSDSEKKEKFKDSDIYNE